MTSSTGIGIPSSARQAASTRHPMISLSISTPSQSKMTSSGAAIGASARARQPGADLLHGLVHLCRRAGIAEADEVVAAQWVEIDARRGGDARLRQHAPGEVVAVLGEARDIRIEVEGAVHRQDL